MGEMSYTTSVGSVTDENMESAPEFFTSMYYEEYNDFGPYWGAETVPTDGPNILHLTQMLWQKSYAVGCAVKSCGQMMLTFCNYRSRGQLTMSQCIKELLLMLSQVTSSTSMATTLASSSTARFPPSALRSARPRLTAAASLMLSWACKRHHAQDEWYRLPHLAIS